jgi:polyphosphate kinase 2 (PPK2 family)
MTWSHRWKSLPAGERADRIFNRSHYEEVLVVRVHSEFLAAQRLPDNAKKSGVWKRRYREIDDRERYLVDKGIKVNNASGFPANRQSGKKLEVLAQRYP